MSILLCHKQSRSELSVSVCLALYHYLSDCLSRSLSLSISGFECLRLPLRLTIILTLTLPLICIMTSLLIWCVYFLAVQMGVGLAGWCSHFNLCWAVNYLYIQYLSPVLPFRPTACTSGFTVLHMTGKSSRAAHRIITYWLWSFCEQGTEDYEFMNFTLAYQF